jgi:thiol:disulfide interchange protein DsbD
MIGQKTEAPVSWKFELNKLSETEYEFKAFATIKNKWNIYSKDMGADGPIPTALIFTSSEFHKLTEPLQEKCKPIKAFDALFEMDVIKIIDKAEYTQKFTTLDKSKPFTGSVTFMCCDHERCLPPANVPFSLNLY